MKETAKKYLDLGWSVLPIIKNQKKASTSWEHLKTVRLTPSQIDEKFYNDSNIGLVCGAISGVLVIDVDSYKGKEGVPEFQIDSPLKAVTPRGGMHYYFKFSPGTQNTVNSKVGIDIRSEGGYVLLPPSTVVNNINGVETVGKYQWLTEPTKELIESLPEAPKSLLDAIYGYNTTSTTQNVSNVANFKPQVDISEYLGLAEGGRNNAISKASLSLLNKIRNVDLTWAAIMHLNSQFNPPLPEAEVRATFESAVKKFQQSPPISSQITSHLLKQPQQAVELPNAPVPTSTNQDILSTIKSLAEGKKRGIPTGFEMLDNITGGFIPGQSYLIYADTSVGKSMFAVNILVSMSFRKVKCLYFDLENDMTLTMERIMFVSNKGKVNLLDYRSHFVSDGKPDVLYLEDVFKPVLDISENFYAWDLNKLTDRFGEITWAGVKKCIDEAIVQGVEVVVIDHLHYFSPAETDHAVLGEIAREINNYAATKNIALVLVAHTKKGLVEVDRKNVKEGEDEKIKVHRPTIDFISGSAMIAKHFKNIIAIQRNHMADTVEERSRTKVYVDKTKFGPAGSFELTYNEQTLVFEPPKVLNYVTQAKTQAVKEMLIDPNQKKIELEVIEEEPVRQPIIVDYQKTVIKPKTEKVFDENDDTANDVPF